ncbi:glycosyltransferase family 39 protein [Streptomyces hundungensis]|uniref:glycosyltransferase family 39 protein n=1 Tax=Streptomyces hundungensis TaxID=1077946 RepID=UPI00340F38F1
MQTTFVRDAGATTPEGCTSASDVMQAGAYRVTGDLAGGRRPVRRTLWVPLIPAAFMLMVGLWGITRQNTMWRDEAATWQASRRSIPEIWHLLSHVDVVHGLYYLLMHGVFALLGEILVSLRLPSVVAMALASVITAKIGMRLRGATAGLCAGLALALLPAVQHYAQEGRSYALVAAGVAYATWLLTGLLCPTGSNSWLRWGLYTATIGCTAWLNWFALLFLPAHAVALCCVRPGRAVVLRWSLCSAVALAGTSPLILFSRGQSAQVSWIGPLTPGALTGPALLIAVGALCALFDGKRRPAVSGISPRALALPLLVIPQVVLLAVSVAKPLYIDRYILFSHLGLALLIGVAAARVHRSVARPWLTVAVGVVALGSVGLPAERRERGPESRVDDVIAPAHVVADTAHAGDGVLFIPAARRDTALVSPEKFSGLDDLALLESPAASGTLKGIEKTPECISLAIAHHRRIILVTDLRSSLTADQDRAKQDALDRYFVQVSDTPAQGRRVAVYERRQAPARSAL